MSEFTIHQKPVDFEVMAQQLEPITDLFDKDFSKLSEGYNTSHYELNREETVQSVADYVMVVSSKSATALSKFIDSEGTVIARGVSNGLESGLGNPTWNHLIVGDRSYSFTTTVDNMRQLVDDTRDMVRIALWRIRQTPSEIKAAADVATTNVLTRETQLRGLTAFALGKARYTRVDGNIEYVVEDGFVVPKEAIDNQRKISLGHVAVAHDQTIASGDVPYTASPYELRLVEPSLVLEALRKATS